MDHVLDITWKLIEIQEFHLQKMDRRRKKFFLQFAYTIINILQCGIQGMGQYNSFLFFLNVFNLSETLKRKLVFYKKNLKKVVKLLPTVFFETF